MRSLTHRGVVAAAAVLAIAGSAATGAAPGTVAAATGATITVTSLGSPVANDGLCSLSEAILAANANKASGLAAGECVAGSASGADTIVFGFAHQTITLTAALPAIAGNVVVDGAGVTTVDFAGNDHLTVGSGVVMLKGLTLLNGNGGIYNNAPAILEIQDSRISGATGDPGLSNFGTVTLVRATLSGDTTAGGSGGGLYNNATATVLDSSITGNSASYGGGIYNAGPLVVRRTTIADNSAAPGSGGGLYNNSTATVTASTFSGNTAGLGGGIYAAFALTMGNVTVSDNGASDAGGGIFNNTFLTATNLTITRNTSLNPGSGVYNALSAVLVNTIIAGNSAGDYAGGAPDAGSGHNRIAPLPSVVLSDVLSDDGLQQNGGPTETDRLVNTAANPFNTAGDPAACAAEPIAGLDQRGVPRPAGSCSVGAVQLERKAPSATAPIVAFQAGGTLTGSATGGRISWTGKDNAGGSGIDHYVVSRSVNGGAWVTAASVPSAHADLPMTAGKSVRFRVRAVDNDGNASGWVYGSTVGPAIVQQSSTSVHFGKAWTTGASPSFAGGSVRWATSAGASAALTAKGRAFAFVTTTDLDRGKARIYVDGVLKATLDLRSSPVRYRYQAWAIRFAGSATHTVKVVVLGTSGRPRVDLDAFLVLR